MSGLNFQFIFFLVAILVGALMPVHAHNQIYRPHAINVPMKLMQCSIFCWVSYVLFSFQYVLALRGKYTWAYREELRSVFLPSCGVLLPRFARPQLKKKYLFELKHGTLMQSLCEFDISAFMFFLSFAETRSWKSGSRERGNNHYCLVGCESCFMIEWV